jgi:phosphatidylglycerol:prolipoprotein diacylglycerol transferase
MFASPGAIAIQIGPITIRWYGLLISGSLLLATALAYREAMRRRQNAGQLLDVVAVAILAGLIGGRLYYVLLYWPIYAAQPLKIFAIWKGGAGVLGVMLGVLLGTSLYCKLKGLPVLIYLDILAPSAALAQAIGLWGNFFNQESFGIPTDLPWKLYVDPAYRLASLQQFDYFHPTFLYQSLWNLIVFAVLTFLLRKRFERIPGALVLCYFGLYALGRFGIEPLRSDSAMLGAFRAPQVLSALLFLTSMVGLIYLRLKRGAVPDG